MPWQLQRRFTFNVHIYGSYIYGFSAFAKKAKVPFIIKLMMLNYRSAAAVESLECFEITMISIIFLYDRRPITSLLVSGCCLLVIGLPWISIPRYRVRSLKLVNSELYLLLLAADI